MPDADLTAVKIIEVGLETRTSGQASIFSYLAPEGAAKGKAYAVPLGRRVVLGYALAVKEVDEDALGFPIGDLRPVVAEAPEFDLPDTSVQAAEYVAQQHASNLGAALQLVTPPRSSARLKFGYAADSPLLKGSTTVATEVWKTVSDAGVLFVDKKSVKPLVATMEDLAKAGHLRKIATLNTRRRPAQEAQTYRLTADDKKIESFLKNEGKRKPAQSWALMRIQGFAEAEFGFQEMRALGEITEHTVKSLLASGIIEPVNKDHPEPAQAPNLNQEQKRAVERVKSAIASKEHHSFLLFGITGSGKTEVYLRLIEEALKWGRSALYLVPEIALTAQVIAHLRLRFGDRVALFHSRMTPAERLEQWKLVQSGESPVVLGPRSALFSPIKDLGVVIVDEEHEGSYKQESAPRYDARRVAKWLSELHGCPIVFGSATPSIESYSRAVSEEPDGWTNELITLTKRAVTDSTLPTTKIIDLREMFASGKPSIFSPPLEQALVETVSRKEQAILFVNRRGYARFVSCRDCGFSFNCPDCAVSLVYHRSHELLKCHLCGLERRMETRCPKCDGTRISPFGLGVERVQEAARRLLPGHIVDRLDRDVAQRKGALEQVLADFRSGKSSVLIGTQMVAKGLDFPNVTLVGVVAADLALNIPDFRASERTFQLITQVSGRAGRAGKAGRVFVQTFNPDHPAIVYASQHDYVSFFEQELELREETRFPPVSRLVNVVCSSQDHTLLCKQIQRLKQEILSELPDIDVLGPVDCPIRQIKGVYRRHLLIRTKGSPPAFTIHRLVKQLESQDVKFIIDVDPQSLM